MSVDPHNSELFRVLVQRGDIRPRYCAICLEVSVRSAGHSLEECLRQLLSALGREVSVCRRRGLDIASPVSMDLWRQYRRAAPMGGRVISRMGALVALTYPPGHPGIECLDIRVAQFQGREPAVIRFPGTETP